MIWFMIFMLLFSPTFPIMASENIGVDAHDTGFRFTDLGWSNEEDDFYEYIPNEGVFKRGTRVYAFLEAAGFSNYFKDDMYHNDLAVDIYLKSSFGLRLFGQRNVIEFNDSAKTPIEDIWFYLYVDIPWWAPRAKYIAEVVIRDKVSGKELKHQEKLTIK